MRKDTGQQHKNFWRELRQARNMQHDAAFNKGCKFMLQVFDHILEKEKAPCKVVERLKVIAGLENNQHDQETYETLTLTEVREKLNYQI